MNEIEEKTSAAAPAYPSLDFIEADCWNKIELGCTTHKHSFHTAVIATIFNGYPEMRTVVLRRVWAASKQLAFHTDIRSGKIEQLIKNPAISWLFYSSNDRIQLRLSGTASIETDSTIVKEAWQKTSCSSRRCYLAHRAPGTASAFATNGLPGIFEHRDPDLTESEEGYKNFAVILTKVNKMEWLWLHHKGHRRAAFEYHEGGTKAHWLVP